jgi:hypothetical protein
MTSLRQCAITEMCIGCNYDEKDKGTWRQQIESCTMKNCPLYGFRPKTIKTEQIERRLRNTDKVGINDGQEGAGLAY